MNELVKQAVRLGLGWVLCWAVAGGAQPNIVLFFVDDMGWDDVGFRNESFETPNIDQLAKDGMSFERASIATPTCSPSRATLLTGLHPARIKMVRHIPHGQENGFDKFGRTEVKENYWPSDPAKFPCPNWLDLEYVTYAENLKELGYYNYFVGKWHLGHEEYHPVKQGFDRQFGTTNWGHPKSYYPPYFKFSDVLKGEKERYLTDRLTDEAVDFIGGYEEEKPFMLSMWYYNVHGPFVGRKDWLEHYEAKGLEGKELNYAAMVSALDDSVGRVRRALKESGKEKDTVVIFLSDQGGYFENKPLRGGKREDTLFEGGARVSFLVSWPGVTTAGAKNHSVIQSLDLFPTLVEMAGGKVKHEIDGVSLMRCLKENKKIDRGLTFGYRAYEDLYASVRDEEWKLLAYRSGKLELYNVEEDVAEAKDLAEEKPAIKERLVKGLMEWEKEMGVEKYSGVQ